MTAITTILHPNCERGLSQLSDHIMHTKITHYLDELKRISDLISVDSINTIINEIVDLKTRNGRIFFIGVGGSAANASHAVNDFRKLLNIESYAISDNVSELTARINDESWDTCYSQWLKVSKLSQNDAIFILSVGGGSLKTSHNIYQAIEYAKQIKATILSIVSRDGGHAKANSNACVLIPTVNQNRITPHAEEWQGIIWHLIVTCILESVHENPIIR